MSGNPGQPSDFERHKRRLERSDHYRNWLAFLFSLIPVIGAALGFSPLANIWTFLGIVVAFVLIMVSVWRHESDGGNRPKSPMGGILSATAIKPGRVWRRAAVVALIFGAGAWVGTSARNAFVLAWNGTLGDLDITAASDITDPAVVSIRKDGGYACFYTTASFHVRNVTGRDVQIGLISNTLAMSDNGGGPLSVNRNLWDITRTSGAVSGAVLITGSPSEVDAKLEGSQNHLTILRRGQSADIAIEQSKDSGIANCLPDPNGKLFQDYRSSIIKMSGEILIIFPDGNAGRESFTVSEPVKIAR